MTDPGPGSDPAAEPGPAAGERPAAAPTDTVGHPAAYEAGPPEGHEPDDPGPPEEDGSPPGHRVRRFWSSRRFPSVITAVLTLAVAGPLLYDIAAVRAGRRAMRWRVRLVDELAHRPLNNEWVITGAAVAAVLGIWLIVLAVTPGLRRLLPMRPTRAPVRAGLERAAAALVVQQRALTVPGVLAVRVAVTRRRIKVRADSHFRELDDVHRDLDTVLARATRGLALERPLRLSLLVRRAGKG